MALSHIWLQLLWPWPNHKWRLLTGMCSDSMLLTISIVSKYQVFYLVVFSLFVMMQVGLVLWFHSTNCDFETEDLNFSPSCKLISSSCAWLSSVCLATFALSCQVNSHGFVSSGGVKSALYWRINGISIFFRFRSSCGRFSHFLCFALMKKSPSELPISLCVFLTRTDESR